MLQHKPERIYQNTHLNHKVSEGLKPLFESTFAQEIKTAGAHGRKELQEERIRFATEQYANRLRVAENLGRSPLFEDADIFGAFGVDKLFESVSAPGNIIGMANVTNPDSSWQHSGGIWNSNYNAGTGDIPTYVFGLQSQLALNCIGFDLIPTIAVDTPEIRLNYVDTVFGGGTIDDAENHPSYVDLKNALFTKAFRANLVRSTTEMIIRVGDGDDKEAMKVLFIMGSGIDTVLTVQILSTGTVNATHVYTEDNATSVKDILEGLTANAKIVVGATATALPGTPGEQVSINYTSSIRTSIVESLTNDGTGKPMTRAQHRKGPKHKLNVVSFDKQVEIEGFELEADTDNIQIKDMAAQGINVISRLYSGVQNQLIQGIDEHITTHLYALGVQHAVQAFQSTGINMSLYIDAPSNANIAMSAVDVEFKDMFGQDRRTAMGNITNSIKSAGYENQMTHADRLFARILLTAEFISYQNRMGTPDFLVTSGTLCAAMKKHSTYTASPVANTLSSQPELHYSGTIFETISVYKNPRIPFNDPRILLGRRGNDTDPGAKFLAYDLAASRQTLAERTMAEKIRVWSRFTIADVGFYPELNYYTMVAINNYEWA